MIFDEAQQAELKKYTYVVYILQALAFITLVTAVVGLIVNYIKQDDVRGSWLESHFRWQKATFWYGSSVDGDRYFDNLDIHRLPGVGRVNYLAHISHRAWLDLPGRR